MTKQGRVPAPVPKVFPSIIRTAGARVLFVAAGCAALVVLGGGGYLLARSKLNSQPAKPTATATGEKKVLGSTTQKTADSQATPTTQSAPAPVSPAPAAAPSTSSTTKKPAEALGFDIAVAVDKIHKQGLAVYIPFTIQRHGGLNTPIVPGNISVTSGGLLANVTIQSEVMLTPDTGAIVLLPLNLGSNLLNVHFSASSGNAIASTSFTYKLSTR